MKSLKIAIFTLFAGFTLASCDFLDKEPYELVPESYFNTASEANSFLTSVYAPLASQHFYGNYYMHMVGTTDMEHYGGARNAYSSGASACNNATSSSPLFNYLWKTLYKGVDRACTFLENIDRVPANEISDALREQYRSEARFLRAFYYFTLVQGWGDVPFRTTATNSVEGLSVPRTDKETIYNFIVTEMSECADGLLSAADLSYQPGRISKSTCWGILARVYLFRAGEHYRDNEAGDATAIQEYFRQASHYAQLVRGEGHDLAENYWDVFIDICSDQYNTTANESIWEIEFAGNYTSETRGEGRIGNMIGIAAPNLANKDDLIGRSDPGYGYAYYWCKPKLFELYEANGDIERMNWTISPFEYVQAVSGDGVTGREFFAGKLDEVKQQYWDKSYQYGEPQNGVNDKGEPIYNKIGDYERNFNNNSDNNRNKNYSRACAKYRREYENPDLKKNQNYTSINFPVLRYSDVLLMIAEAENEINGDMTLAYECLNEVRDRAGISTYAEGRMSQEEFRQAVKDERAMELSFEYLRRYDLIRWGEYISSVNELAPRAMQGLDANWNRGNTGNDNSYPCYPYFQIPESYNYFPIPDSEISTNTEMTQNPGW